MRSSLLIFIVAIAGLLIGCSDDGATVLVAEGECRSLEISGNSYRMLLPMGAAIEADGARGSVMIHPKPQGRLVRFLSIAPLAGATVPPPTDSTTLANGLTLSYALDDDIGGGSGGPVAELIGDMLLDARTPLMIVCHDQQEGGANAEWCLEPLGTLAPETPPKACK